MPIITLPLHAKKDMEAVSRQLEEYWTTTLMGPWNSKGLLNRCPSMSYCCSHHEKVLGVTIEF